MEKKELIDTFEKIERDTEHTLNTLKDLKSEVSRLTEENNTLRLENQHLRDRLNEQVNDEQVKKPSSGLTKSRMNLENIYEDGFHVCNMLFGQRRVEDEPCAFCLGVIYGERQ